jgi:hypothetical protein
MRAVAEICKPDLGSTFLAFNEERVLVDKIKKSDLGFSNHFLLFRDVFTRRKNNGYAA